MTGALFLVLPACAIAGITDVTSRRVPNWLTAVLAIAALIFNATHGLVPALLSLGVMVAVLLLGALAFSQGWIGGGDVKLAAAAAGALSYPACIPFLLYTIFGGGVLAVAYALLRGRLKQTFAGVGTLAFPIFHGGAGKATPTNMTPMPYALAIGLGAILVLLSQTVAPFLRIPL
jgi:prepilin peptidase CpaA